MKVTIITVCLNAEKTIERTILSVIEQSYGIDDIEYIIIDGNSTDGTKCIIEKYSQYIAEYISESDTGLYNAMNKGLSLATGDVIGILNADDWYDKDAIKTVINAFEDADIVYGNIYSADPDGEIRKKKKPCSLSDLWVHMCLFHPATFVRRDVYAAEGTFNETYKIAADYDFLLKCYARGRKFKYIDEYLAYFRSGGISCTDFARTAIEAAKVSNSYAQFAPDTDRVARENKYALNVAGFREHLEHDDRHMFDIFKRESADKLFLWGAGIWGNRILDAFIRNDIDICGFIDSDPNKTGKIIHGYDIKKIDILKELENVTVIVAIIQRNTEIEDILRNYKVNYLFLEDWIKMSDFYPNEVCEYE